MNNNDTLLGRLRDRLEEKRWTPSDDKIDLYNKLEELEGNVTLEFTVKENDIVYVIDSEVHHLWTESIDYSQFKDYQHYGRCSNVETINLINYLKDFLKQNNLTMRQWAIHEVL